MTAPTTPHGATLHSILDAIAVAGATISDVGNLVNTAHGVLDEILALVPAQTEGEGINPVTLSEPPQ